MTKNKIINYCDHVIIFSLCILIFFLPFSKAVAESFTLLAFVLWVLKRVLGYRSGSSWGMFPKTALNKALGLFIAANVLSVIFSVDYGLSLRGLFGKELKFLVIFFMIVEVINSRERLRSILIAIIASVMLILADAGVQYFRGVDFLRGYQYSRLSASFAAANGFAAWLIVIIPLIIGIFMWMRATHRRLKIVLFLMILMLASCLMLTYSRGAWLGIMAALILMSYYILRSSGLKTKIRYLCFIICLLAIFLFVSRLINIKMQKVDKVNFDSGQTVGERIKSIIRINEGASLVRINLWKESLKIINVYPLTGCGLNTYSIVAREYKSFDGGGIYSHNSYLQRATETGLLGLFVFLWVLFKLFKIGLWNLNRKKNFLLLGLLSGILAFLVQSFFDTHFYSLQLVVLFWYMCGLMVAVINLELDISRFPKDEK